jgi:hypothetical protein
MFLIQFKPNPVQMSLIFLLPWWPISPFHKTISCIESYVLTMLQWVSDIYSIGGAALQNAQFGIMYQTTLLQGIVGVSYPIN